MNKDVNAHNGQGSQDRQNKKNLIPDNQLPYPDPAIINPEELATFPKRSQQSNPGDIEDEKESHLVNKRSPLREGRNITRTDNNPDNDGFM